MADHFTYLPLIGLFVMVAWGGQDLLARWPVPPPGLKASALALLLALGCTRGGRSDTGTTRPGCSRTRSR